jgi:hypothetical protein
VPRAALDPRSAPQLIIDLVRAHPGEVTILAVGRLTNLATALALAPDLPHLVKRVVIMGGAFGYNYQGQRSGSNPFSVAEANIGGDPEAADEVINAGWPVTLVPLDVTIRTVMDRAYLTALPGKDGALIRAITRQTYVNAQGSMPVHDSSAVFYALRPSAYTTVEGVVRVEPGTGPAAGITVMAPPAAAIRALQGMARSMSPPGWMRLPCWHSMRRACATRVANSSDRLGQRGRQRLDPACVFLVEAGEGGAVEIDHRDHHAIALDRHDQLRCAGRVAGDVAGEGVDVAHQLRFAGGGSGAAHALAQWNADAGGLAGERPEHQRLADPAIEPGPVAIGQRHGQQRGDIGHIGHAIALAMDQPARGGDQIGIERGLVGGIEMKIVHDASV